MAGGGTWGMVSFGDRPGNGTGLEGWGSHREGREDREGDGHYHYHRNRISRKGAKAQRTASAENSPSH